MIVLVEDNKLLAQVLGIVLAPAKVLIAPDARAAEAAVRAAGPEDTVLVDLQLPDSNPADTLCRIARWKSRPDAPRVIVITGSSDTGILRAAELAADGLALKNGTTGLFDALKGMGIVRRPAHPCTCAETVDQIERETMALTGA